MQDCRWTALVPPRPCPASEVVRLSNIISLDRAKRVARARPPGAPADAGGNYFWLDRTTDRWLKLAQWSDPSTPELLPLDWVKVQEAVVRLVHVMGPDRCQEFCAQQL